LESLKRLIEKRDQVAAYEKDPVKERRGGGRNNDDTYPVHFLLDRFSVLHNGDIYLVVLVNFIRFRRSFIVLLLVLVSKVLTNDEKDEGGSCRTSAYDGEGDPVPWLVLRLPDEGSSSVAYGVGDQDRGVDCDAFGVSSRRHADPREEDDEWDDAPD
jgi:hypothetical protein